MPALAHCDLDVHDDIDDDYKYGNDQASTSTSLHAVDNIVASAAGSSSGNGGGRMMNVGNNNSNDHTTSRFMGGSGGGGGGNRGGSHHRCPKCGATVTFQDVTKGQQQHHQKNCFYCAACSGWFLIKPPSSSTAELEDSKFLLSKMAEVAGDDAEKVVGGVSASGQPPNNRKISQPQFVMQHVSVVLFLFYLMSR